MSKILMSNGRFISKYGAITKDFNPLAYSQTLYDAVDPYVVAHWSFDNDLVSDSKGSNTLTNNGGVTAVAGKNRSGAGFNGSSQYLSVADSDNWDLGAGQFTVGGWFNWTSSPGVAEMITHGGNALVTEKAGWNIISEGSNRLDFMVYPTAAYDLNLYALGLSLGTGIWHLVLVTRNAANRVDIWLDGVSIVNQLNYTTNINFGTSELRLGTSHENNRYFPGKMDEISVIKGFAASSSQILEMYNSGIGRFYSEPIYVANTLPIPPSKSYSNSLYDAINPYIVANWNFDKDLTSDSKGSNTLTNNGGVTSVAGKNNNGASFSGSSQYLSTPYFANSDFGTADFSISMWFYFNAFPTDGKSVGLFSKNVGNNTYVLDIGYDRVGGDDLLYAQTYDGSKVQYVQGVAINVSTWYHIVIKRASGVFSMYLNDVLKGSYTGAGASNLSFNEEIRLGYSKAPDSEYFNGKMDEILIIKGLALSPSQITELYNYGQGKYYRRKTLKSVYSPQWSANNSLLRTYDPYIVSLWPLTEQSGTRYDIMGSNHLTDNGSVGYVSDVTFGNVADFSGSNYLEILDNASLNPSTGAAYSVWFKADSITGGHTLFAKFAESEGVESPWMILENTDSLFRMKQSNGTTKTVYDVTLSTGQWYNMIGIACPTTGKVYLYRNGVSVGTPATYNSTLITNTAPFVVGRFRANPSGYYYDGKMHYLTYWKNIDFASQEAIDAFVAAIYNGGNGVEWKTTP